VRGLLGGDRGDGVAEFAIEPAQHVESLGGFGNWLPEITKGFGEFLQLGGVIGDGEIALVQAAVLRLQVHGPVQLVVAEEVDDGGPDGVGGGAGNTDDAQDVAGDCVVDPVEQALVDHDPVWVGALGGGWSIGDVGLETELAEDGIEEAPPLEVVGIDNVEDQQDVRFDVHHRKRGGRKWWGRWRCPAMVERSSERGNGSSRGGGGGKNRHGRTSQTRIAD